MYNFVKMQLESGNVTWLEIRGKLLENCLGGRMEFDRMTQEPLEIVEAESMDDLDWSGTSFDDANAKEGWLAPDGKFYGCSFGSHDIAARYMFKKSPSEVRLCGYGKVHAKHMLTGKPFVVFDLGVEPTQAQKKWMEEMTM
jgi:hypothetical protein